MKYLGSVFACEFGGFLFNISFKCEEITENETGLMVAEVFNVRVLDSDGAIVNQWMDMDVIKRLCYERALEVLSHHNPPECNDG